MGRSQLLAAGSLVVACLLALTGCEDTQQRSARRSLQAHLRTLPHDSGYRVDSARCTSSGRVGFVNVVATSRFVCLVQRPDGTCDRFQVLLRRRGPAAVVLARRDVGCVLPL